MINKKIEQKILKPKLQDCFSTICNILSYMTVKRNSEEKKNLLLGNNFITP